jgi:hypothetical protein
MNRKVPPTSETVVIAERQVDEPGRAMKQSRSYPNHVAEEAGAGRRPNVRFDRSRIERHQFPTLDSVD